MWIKWLELIDLYPDNNLVITVIHSGYVDVLEWLKITGRMIRDPYSGMLVNVAAFTGQIKVLEWLFKNGFTPDVYILPRMAQEGKFEVVKCLLERARGVWDLHGSLEWAARMGHVEIVRYLVERYPLRDSNIMTVAAFHDRLEVIKILRENGSHWNEDTVERASTAGNLEVVKYLVNNGCPWRWWHVYWHGKPEVLKWLRSQWSLW